MDFKSICVGFCTAAFLFVAVESGFFIRELRIKTLPQITLTAQNLNQSAQDLDTTAKDLDKTVQQLDVLIESSATVVNNVNDTATQEQKFLVTESREFLKTTAAVKQIIVSTDYNLNKQDTGLLPRLNADLDQQSASLLRLQSQANEAVTALLPVETNLAATSLVLSDGVKQITPEIVGTSKSVHAAADDGKEVADAYKQKLLHPLRTFWSDVSFVGDSILKILEAHAYWP